MLPLSFTRTSKSAQCHLLRRRAWCTGHGAPTCAPWSGPRSGPLQTMRHPRNMPFFGPYEKTVANSTLLNFVLGFMPKVGGVGDGSEQESQESDLRDEKVLQPRGVTSRCDTRVTGLTRLGGRNRRLKIKTCRTSRSQCGMSLSVLTCLHRPFFENRIHAMPCHAVH